MSIQAQFDKAVAIVQGLPKDGPVQPSQDDKLAFYGAYKQANEGDAQGSGPGMFDFVGKAKFKAWKALEGTSQEDAKKKYVELLKAILQKQDDEESTKYIAELEAAA
ncbi:uncharacterized protein L201_001297 [Kwoniella dendrophila CBS 6074]|uniref:ACB domain-containing protein n=1 Tax=Kwoniella dendrophila CBS 6074 TaxID=1295534 RepID=A0AAX4JPD9_9TREE